MYYFAIEPGADTIREQFEVVLNSDQEIDKTSGAVQVGPPLKFATRIARKVFIKQSHFLSERKSWSNLELTVLGGQCQVEFDGRTITLQSHDRLKIPAHIEHRITALTDARIIACFDAVAGEMQQTPPLRLGAHRSLNENRICNRSVVEIG